MSLTSTIRSWSRSQSTGIAAGLFLITIVAFLRPPLLPDMGRDLSLSAFGLGALGSVFALGRLAADIPAGRLTDRTRPGPMMAFAAANVAAGSIGLAISENSTVAFVAIFFLGIGSTWTLTTAMAHFASAPSARRGASLSFFAAALLTGQAIGPAVGGWLGAAYDWRVALWVGGGAAVLVGLPFLARRTTATSPTPVRGGVPISPGKTREVVFWVLYLLPAVQFSVGAAMIQTLVPLVADGAYRLGPAVVGGALALGGASRLAAALVSGVLIDRVSRRSALIPGLVLQVVGLAAFAFGDTLVWWWLSIMLVSLGSIGVNTGSVVIADLSGPVGMGRRLGAFRFTGDSAFMVAPLLAGWLFDGYGRTVAMMPLLVFATAVALAVTVLVPETHPRIYNRLHDHPDTDTE